MNNDTLLKDLLYFDGRQKFVMKIVEELAELQVAILHYEQERNTAADVMIEVSDVKLQVEKIIQLLQEDGQIGVEDYIDRITENTKEMLRDHVYGIIK